MQITIQEEKFSQACKYNILDIFLEVVEENSDAFSQNSSENSLSDNNCFSMIQSYSQVKKSNIIKNILKSFQRYVEDANAQDQDLLCQIAKKSYSYSQLKKLIKRNFKTFGKRWNMKLKYLIERCSYKGLFQYYLQNKSTEWLNNSKVQNKEDHQIVINFLIEAINNPEYSSEIKYYKKYKQTLTQI